MHDQKIVEVLLVEDNPADEKLTLKALEKNRIVNNVFVVRDGAQALDYIFHKGKYENIEKKNNKLKLILLDLKLPKVDGIEVLKQIKSDERTKMIPVVVLTSSHEESDIVKSYKYGVNSYIVKPIDFEQFIEAVSNLGLYWLILNVPCGEDE